MQSADICKSCSKCCELHDILFITVERAGVSCTDIYKSCSKCCELHDILFIKVERAGVSCTDICKSCSKCCELHDILFIIDYQTNIFAVPHLILVKRSLLFNKVEGAKALLGSAVQISCFTSDKSRRDYPRKQRQS